MDIGPVADLVDELLRRDPRTRYVSRVEPLRPNADDTAPTRYELQVTLWGGHRATVAVEVTPEEENHG